VAVRHNTCDFAALCSRADILYDINHLLILRCSSGLHNAAARSVELVAKIVLVSTRSNREFACVYYMFVQWDEFLFKLNKIFSTLMSIKSVKFQHYLHGHSPTQKSFFNCHPFHSTGLRD